MLEAQINLNGPDCQLLFPTPRGRLWRERTFYRDLWKPTQEASGLDIRPHECRHSYGTHLRAARVNDADLAEITGHRGRDDARPLYACDWNQLQRHPRCNRMTKRPLGMRASSPYVGIAPSNDQGGRSGGACLQKSSISRFPIYFLM